MNTFPQRCLKSKTALTLAIVLCTSASALRAEWRPSIRFGETIRVDFRAMIQTDARSFSPHLSKEAAFELNRVRFGVKGRMFKHFEYEGEYEVRESFGGRRS